MVTNRRKWADHVHPRLSSLRLSPTREHEIVEELSQHLEDRWRELVAGGTPEDEATRLALAEFREGNLLANHMAPLQQAQRPAPITPGAPTGHVMRDAWQDLRYALRMLRANPAFSLSAILTLALGIGATTAMFSVVNGIVIKPLPYPDADAVMTVTHSAVFGNVRSNTFPFSPQMLAVYGPNGQAFEELGLWRLGQAAVTGFGDPEQANTLLLTHTTLRALGVQPVLGRWFSGVDDQPGAPETVILSYGYWQRRFGGDPGVIGRTITADSRPRQVIGVMPARFRLFMATPDLILPSRINLAQPPADFNYNALARLKPGIGVAQANADIARMLPVYLERYAGNRMDALQLRPAVRPLKEDVIGNVGDVLWLLLGTIAIVLVIACANVANLLLVRVTSRGQEFAVRAALGAGRWRIARSLMVESVTLGVLGGVLGLALAYGGLQVLMAVAPPGLPRLDEITIDPAVLIFTVATSIVSGLLFGMIPMAKLVRSKYAARVSESLRGAARGSSAGRSQHRSQNALVVVQVALALVLLVTSGLMIRTFYNLRQVDPGFTDPATIQTVRIAVPDAMADEPERVTQIQMAIRERLASIPGVTSAAYTSALPVERPGDVIVYPEGNTYGPGELPPVRRIKSISPGLLQTLGTRLRAGRDFEWVEISTQRNVALVSESFARETWNSVEAALGKRLRVGVIGPWQDVIGVVADVHDNGPDQKAPAMVYQPAREHPLITGNVSPLSVAFVIRSDRTGTESFVQDIRRAVSEVAPDLPLFMVRTLREVYEGSMARTSFSLVMLAIAGGMALVLGIVGIYGVLAYAVMQRRREVGIRLALGAQSGNVKRLFVYRGLMLSGVGIAIGAAVAAGITQWMSSLLFGVTPIDAATFAAAAIVLALAALAASYLPAHRAAAVDPVETLSGQ
jgi:putative ABC transport system permease protein